ncbi:hypothetical protein GH733_007322 [Mirounga leonina]|nr:hypothetical protein GH733_007322 [Mirounga leonina]
MEEMGKTAVEVQRPIKTEWNFWCAFFTYFQGAISSMSFEHCQEPQGLSPLSQSEDVILTDDNNMSPNQRGCFSSQWTKPQPEASLTYSVTNCSLNGSYAYGSVPRVPGEDLFHSVWQAVAFPLLSPFQLSRA